jgi:hypothetical protein
LQTTKITTALAHPSIVSRDHVSWDFVIKKERKKEITYTEGKMNDIGAHVGYTVLWDKVLKVVGAGTQIFYYPAAPPFHVIAVLSGTRVVRVLYVWVATP